jgi:hypothetical protein
LFFGDDVVIASETWLHQGILEREVLPENYRFVARRDRLKSAHRGVAVIAKSDLEGVVFRWLSPDKGLINSK